MEGRRGVLVEGRRCRGARPARFERRRILTRTPLSPPLVADEGSGGGSRGGTTFLISQAKAQAAAREEERMSDKQRKNRRKVGRHLT